MGRAHRRIGGGRRAHAPGRQGALAAAARRPRGRLSLPHRRAARDEPESARIARFERDLRNLAHLRQFALPIIDALADWPERATWGEWLDRFAALATQALVRPTRVLQTLADLRPMAERRTGDARGSARRAARSARDARLGSAGPPVRPAVRRHAASGARPLVPRRVRAGPGRARRAAAAARGSAAARRAPPRARRRRWSARTSAAAPSACC